ncbi:uncharacterized protein LOC135387495 [Ornithodoros turicata]|uniref:uncharacterized protein LOC135387495 n=1 Tax=Ornithodoros turicata TaxID=34597 RepID=UPI0031387BB9
MLITRFLTLAIASVAAVLGNDTCPSKLPWRMQPQDFTEIPLAFHHLLHCPQELNSCADTLFTCDPPEVVNTTLQTYIQTCSCATNCVYNRDCCWEVPYTDDPLPPAASCNMINIGQTRKKEIYMVSECADGWTESTARSGCETLEDYPDAFYRIPVTSVRDVTYANGFCALCNYDLTTNAVFWNATDSSRMVPTLDQLPEWATDKPHIHLRPCSFYALYDTCPNDTDPRVTRKCQKYFAPITSQEDMNSVVYRNVYCALCNGIEMSNLTCAETKHVTSFTAVFQKGHGMGPNLAAILRPVVSGKSCLAEHNGVCYIRSVDYYQKTNTEVSGANSTNSTDTINVYSDSVQVAFTIICISLSLVCLFLKGVAFVINEDARSLSYVCTLLLSGTLFVSQLLFLLVNSFPMPPMACKISAMTLHYGFLSTFFWTSVLSYDIWGSLTTIAHRVKPFMAYSVIAWGSPLIVVSLALAVDTAVPGLDIAPHYGETVFNCWIGSPWALLTFFLVPAVCSICVNVGLYVGTVRYVRDTAKSIASFKIHAGKRVSYQLLFVKLVFIMGLTWIVAFVGAFVSNVIIDVFVILLVGLQGVFLFFGFKDYEQFRKLCQSKKSLPQSATTVPAQCCL